MVQNAPPLCPRTSGDKILLMDLGRTPEEPPDVKPGYMPRIFPYAAFLGIIGVYYFVAVVLGLQPALGRGLSAAIGVRIVPLLVVFYLLGLGIWTALVRERTVSGTAKRLRAEALSWDMVERLVGIPFFILGTVFIFDIYATFKQAIPELTAYGSDPWLAAVDGFLHLGRDPWRWSHSVLGEAGLAFLDQVYTSWYAVLVASIPIFATWAPNRIRHRFFLTFSAVMMMGGSFGAILFASGGPAYFGEFTGNAARFGPLLEALQGTQALATQGRLWEYFSSEATNLYGGISAMPSMHVAVVVLIGIAGTRWNRWVGLAAVGYAGLIFVGSFHLGWHYAVDGYASAVLVGTIWFLTRWVVAERSVT